MIGSVWRDVVKTYHSSRQKYRWQIIEQDNNTVFSLNCLDKWSFVEILISPINDTHFTGALIAWRTAQCILKNGKNTGTGIVYR